MSFKCPRCGIVSHNPEDERQGWCGRCNEFTEKRAPLESAEVVARDIGRIVKRAMPKGWGFCLLLADFSEADGFMTYVSSIERADAVKFLRETALKIENQEKSL